MIIRLCKSIALVSLLSSMLVIFQLSDRNSVTSSEKIESSQKAVSLSLAGITPTLGFGNVFSDVYLLGFLEYFGDDEIRKVYGYTLSPEYISASLEFDPYYRYLYFFLSESTTVYAGMPEKTVNLINKELPHFEKNRPSDSFYLWRYKGMDELLFLNRGKDAASSFKKAAEWAEDSDHPDSKVIARLSLKTSEFLESNPDSRQARISSWASILTTSSDEKTTKRAIREIEKLGGQIFTDNDGRTRIRY